MYSGIIPIIKKAALDAVNSTQPVNILFGKVTSVSPLKVQISPKLVLEGNNLVITSRISDDVELKKNDSVILVRIQGGNAYLVLDKAVKT